MVRPTIRGLACLSVAVLLAASAVWAEAPQPGRAPVRKRLIRTWPEDVKVGNQSRVGRVEMWFDYRTGRVTQRIIADAAPGHRRKVLQTRTFPPGVNTPRPSEDEIAEATAMVQGDPELRSLISGARAALDGGFQIFEPAGKPCGPGSRCIKIQIMTADRLGTIRNTVADLVTQSIVYRNWAPEGPGGKK